MWELKPGDIFRMTSVPEDVECPKEILVATSEGKIGENGQSAVMSVRFVEDPDQAKYEPKSQAN